MKNEKSKETLVSHVSGYREEMLAGELDEMILLGWTDEEAKADPEAFFEGIGKAAEGFAAEDVWQAWDRVWNRAMEDVWAMLDEKAKSIISKGLYKTAECLMDDDIREDLHRELAPCSEEKFLSEYMRRHYNEYGEVFSV